MCDVYETKSFIILAIFNCSAHKTKSFVAVKKNLRFVTCLKICQNSQKKILIASKILDFQFLNLKKEIRLRHVV